MDDIIKNTTFPRRWSFRELDFFSGGTSIKVKTDDRVKSVLGGLITIAIYILLGLATGYYISQFLDQEHPRIQLNSKLQSEPSRFKTSSGGIGVMYLFFLISNPSTQAGITTPYYVNMDSLSSFYTVTSEYIKNRYTIKNGITYKATDLTRPVRLLNCNRAAWFSKPEFQKILTANTLTYFMIKEYGVCAEFADEMEFYGDEQTNELGRYKFQITPCSKSPGCASQELMNVNGQSVIVGTFQPVANNSRAHDPWDYEFNMDNSIAIGSLLSSKVNFNLKNIEVSTDTGVIISQVTTENRAAIDSVRITYDPVVSMGDAIPGVGKNFGVKSLPTKPAFELKIISSRKIEQIGRSYDSLLDLFGNIGGSLEFIIAIFLVFFHWVENILIDARIKAVVAKYLNLPELVQPQQRQSCFSKCKKKEKKAAIAVASAKAIAEVVEAAVSVEQMSYNQLMLRFFLEHTLPNDILQLIPAVTIFKELLEKIDLESLVKKNEEQISRKVTFDTEAKELTNSTNLINPGFDFDSWIPKEHSDKAQNQLQDQIVETKALPLEATPMKSSTDDGNLNEERQQPLVRQTTLKLERQFSSISELKPALKASSARYIPPLAFGQIMAVSPGLKPKSPFARLAQSYQELPSPFPSEYSPVVESRPYPIDPTGEIPRESESYVRQISSFSKQPVQATGNESNDIKDSEQPKDLSTPSEPAYSRNTSIRESSAYQSGAVTLSVSQTTSNPGLNTKSGVISKERRQSFMRLAKTNLLNAYYELKDRSKEKDAYQQMRLDLLETISKFAAAVGSNSVEDIFFEKQDLGGIAVFWTAFNTQNIQQ